MKSPSSLVKKELFQSGTIAKKRLGQHFLTDPAIIQTIISAAKLTTSDTVLEIGPGLGILTEQLVKSSVSVLAIEVDKNLVRLLQRKFRNTSNITILHEDILRVDLLHLLKDRKSYKVVANLPYNISSPVLKYFIDATIKPKLMVIMLQKEVAESIIAPEGKLSALAISFQLFARPCMIAYVPSESFYPRPKVDSAVLKIEFLEETDIIVDNTEVFLEMVRQGFRAPRKQLKNSLALGMNIDMQDILSILHKADINTEQRPGALSLHDWQRIYRVMLQEGRL